MVAWSTLGRSFARTSEFTQLFKNVTVSQVGKNGNEIENLCANHIFEAIWMALSCEKCEWKIV